MAEVPVACSPNAAGLATGNDRAPVAGEEMSQTATFAPLIPIVGNAMTAGSTSNTPQRNIAAEAA